MNVMEMSTLELLKRIRRSDSLSLVRTFSEIMEDLLPDNEHELFVEFISGNFEESYLDEIELLSLREIILLLRNSDLESTELRVFISTLKPRILLMEMM